jgi:diguanylate cyclase (GGDEF)-like protein
MLPITHIRTLVLCVIAVMMAMVMPGQQFAFRQYGPSDGLTNLGINAILQDHTGYLWVGTDNGLFRYDGSRFQAFSHPEGLPDTEIRSLAESPDGELWVATQSGVARRDGFKFIPVDVGLKGLFLAVAFDTGGSLYLEHATGILRGVRDSGGVYRFTMVAPGAVGGLLVKGDDVWFRRDRDLWHLHGDKVERVGSLAGLPADQWGSINLDADGNLWVRSSTRLYELPHGQSMFLDRSEGIPNSTVTRVYADKYGRVFVSTAMGVVVLSGPFHANRSYIDAQHGLPDDVASSVLVDRDNSLWIGMRGGGLLRLLGHGEWLSWKKADGLLNDSVWSVLHARDGRLWIGSSGGLNIFDADGKPALSFTSHSGLMGDNVYALVEAPSGEIFTGTTPAGITRFSAAGKLLRSYGPTSGLNAEQVNGVSLDHQNRLWVATAQGTFRSRASIDGADLKFDRVDAPGLPPGTYSYDIHVDDGGVVWITTTNGLLRFDGVQWRLFTKANGLRSDDLVSMAFGHDEIWIAYRDAWGISRMRFHGERSEITHFGQRDGLSSDLIYALVMDHKGRLWVSTDNGVSVLQNDRWKHYDMEDGLNWDDGNDRALSVDAKDNVWVGTSRGLARFSVPPIPIPENPASVVLTEIQAGVQQFQAGDHPVLTHAQNSLLIQYSALDFASEGHTRYRYRLLGSSDRWSETSEKSVRFEGLPSGKYVFEVGAAGPNGLWSQLPASFAFTVQPPWWLTWWFIGACVVVTVLLASAFWQYRVRALIVQKDLLEQQVKDRTAELQESHRQLEEIAYYDVLTTLPNRRMFTEQFRSRLAVSRRYGTPFALLLIDLDNFKDTNDTYGHDAGDAVLIGAASLLKLAVRQSDCVARLGGDEFAILLISANDATSIRVVCERIVQSLGLGIDYQNAILKAHCSVGVALFPIDGDTQDRMYKSADLAMYEAKRLGGNQFCQFLPEMAAKRQSGGDGEVS